MRSVVTGCLFYLLPFLSYATIAGQSNAAIDSMARASYHAGHFMEASEDWKSLARSGIMNANLYYNIGRAESELGHIADAISWYEKSLRLLPFNKEVKLALEMERNKISKAVIPVKPFFISTWWKNFISAMRPGNWAVLGFLLWLITLLVWFKQMKVLKLTWMKLSGKPWIYGLAGVVIMCIALGSYRQLYRMNEAIIYKACEMKQGPASQSPQQRILEIGEKVKIVDELPGWYKVNLVNLDEGWIETGCLKRIDLREYQ
jgi:tetratricopeptide (TPR) repeat protein